MAFSNPELRDVSMVIVEDFQELHMIIAAIIIVIKMLLNVSNILPINHILTKKL